MNIDLETVKEIIELFEDSGVREIRIEEDDFKVHLKGRQRPSPKTPSLSDQPEGEIVPVTSLEVGEFYRRPLTQEEPLVEKGDIVEQGAQLGVVESLNVEREIRAEQEGEIVNFKVEEGEPVEYGTVLLTMKVFPSEEN